MVQLCGSSLYIIYKSANNVLTCSFLQEGLFYLVSSLLQLFV